jgi:hypothetical protein
VTPEQKYSFDVNGYLLVKGALDQSHISALNSSWDAHSSDGALFDICFAWGEEWASLVDHPALIDILLCLFDGMPRLDHAFCVNEAFVSSAGRLHHHSKMHTSGVFHAVHDGIFHVGLLGVTIALLPIPNSSGGFCCVPGSHKAHFPVPADWFDVANNPLLQTVPQDAGDILVFSEALVHGTYPAQPDFRRRSIFLRYTPGYMVYRALPHTIEIDRLPVTPNHTDPKTHPSSINASQLTHRQRSIICQPPFSRGRRRILESA